MAMNVEALKRILVDQREIMEEKLKQGKIIERELKIAPKFPHAYIITGVRRAGKSTLAFISSQNPLYVNFEDPNLLGFDIKDYMKLIQAGYEVFGYFDTIVFDEVQEVEGWEKMVSFLMEKYKVIVTGSNARLLSHEFSTYLTGRYLKFTLFPFSFREFLTYKGASLNVYSTRDIASVKKLLNEYIKIGGFPEALKLGREFLINLYDDIITRDVAVRYNVRNFRELKELAFYVLSNFSARITYNKLKNLFKIGNLQTVKNYIEYLTSAYLIFEVPKFSFKLKDQLTGERKVYTVDVGLINAIVPRISENIGRIMENLVFLELMRRKHYREKDIEIYYYKDTRGREVDFLIVSGREKEAIQVTYASDVDEIPKREINNLIALSKEFGLREGIIVTWDLEDKISMENIRLKFVPLWKFLITGSI
ncbi:ATP-binding protein [Pyrococcus kukulkanii]|uniref:ATP-binding protein n=1 Tax=Pyrococcus kukulkanii TaxID=1609559 RepID=A0ABV4T5J3_9EURY